MKSGVSRREALRADRKETLREYLKSRGHDQYAFDLIMKLQDLGTELDSTQVQRLNTALNGHFKFLNKYLPDLKAVEISGTLGVAELSDEQLDAEIAKEFTESAT